jgi:hypothetical protein
MEVVCYDDGRRFNRLPEHGLRSQRQAAVTVRGRVEEMHFLAGRALCQQRGQHLTQARYAHVMGQQGFGTDVHTVDQVDAVQPVFGLGRAG